MYLSLDTCSYSVRRLVLHYCKRYDKITLVVDSVVLHISIRQLVILQQCVCVLGCDYFGTVYALGQQFVGNDGCSNCYCGANGEVTCDNSPCSKCGQA